MIDFATVAGLALGIIILLVALLCGGVPVQTILQPEAILVVFGGTLTALLINFSLEELQFALEGIYKTFRQPQLSPEEVVETLTDASTYIRAKGILALQPLLEQVQIPFLQKGLQMVVDNQPVEHIRAKMTTELEVQYRLDTLYAKVFEAAAGFCPTMGIIGAIIGLIRMMNLFDSPEKLGHGVAAAFMATLYGVGTANLFLLPIAGKLKQRAKSEWFLKSIMLHGLIGIREGENPMLLREQLESYLVQRDTPPQQIQQESPELYYNNTVGAY